MSFPFKKKQSIYSNDSRRALDSLKDIAAADTGHVEVVKLLLDAEEVNGHAS